MTGKKRIWFPGASYHITARGNRRNDIFKDGEDLKLSFSNLSEDFRKVRNIKWSVKTLKLLL